MPKKVKSKRVRRGRRKDSRDIVTYMSKHLLPYPPRYRTKFHTSIYGSIAGGAVASGAYYLLGNSCYRPFAGGGWPSPNPAIANLAPTGYSQMCTANLYNAQRVYAFSIRVEFIPQALTDTVEVCLTPTQVIGQPSSTAVAMTMPFTKKGLFSSSKNNTNSKNGNALTLFVQMHKFWGTNKFIMDNDISGQFDGDYMAPPSQKAYCQLNWATPDAVNTAQPLEYRIDLVQYVELFQNTQNTMTQT